MSGFFSRSEYYKAKMRTQKHRVASNMKQRNFIRKENSGHGLCNHVKV